MVLVTHNPLEVLTEARCYSCWALVNHVAGDSRVEGQNHTVKNAWGGREEIFMILSFSQSHW